MTEARKIAMTTDVAMLLPMLGACFIDLTPTLLGDAPIYDSLRERALERERARLGMTGNT